MQWGEELRAYRARTGVKQEGLATQLKISQAFVSRLESGRVEPNAELSLRIRALLAHPGNRSVLDHVLASVRLNPQVICVIEPTADNMRYVALSAGFRAHPQFVASEEGGVFRTEAAEDGVELIRQISQSGAFSGRVESIDVLWTARIDGGTYYWNAINTPIRLEPDRWLMHCAMSELTAREFDTRKAARTEPVLVRHYQ